MRLGCAALLLLTAGWLAGCHAPRRAGVDSPTWARFFLEAQDQADGTELSLPRSGVRLAVNARPVLTEADILDVELMQVELGKCLRFQLTPAAARDFYRLSGSHQGRRLVLLVNDAPLGARRIDGAIADGFVYVFVEKPDEQLPTLVNDLKKSAAAFHREQARKG